MQNVVYAVLPLVIGHAVCFIYIYMYIYITFVKQKVLVGYSLDESFNWNYFSTRMVGISLTGLLDKTIKNGDNYLKLSNTNVKLWLPSRSSILTKVKLFSIIDCCHILNI